MLKNIIGSIVFVVVVFALISFIGDTMVSPTTVAQKPRPLTAEVQVAPAKTAAPQPTSAPETAEAPEEAPEEAMPSAAEQALALVGDAAKGKKTFRKKCMGCHTPDKGEADRTGPNLWGIVGREKGASENFRYSASLRAMGGVWSEADILGFIAGPRTFLPDTKMTFAGLKKAQDRADIVAYLNTLKD